MSDESDKNELDSKVGKIGETAKNDPALSADVKHLIENGMDQYFKLRNREIDVEEQELVSDERKHADAQVTERLKFSVKSGILVVLMAALILLSIFGYLTTELAIALGIGIGTVFNIDILGFIK